MLSFDPISGLPLAAAPYVPNTYDQIATGGVVVGSGANVGSIYNVTTSGGIVAGGSCSMLCLYSPAESGGVLANSSAPTFFIYSPATSGGVLAGSAGEVFCLRSLGTSGGLLANGSAPFVFVFDAGWAGGMVASGSNTSNGILVSDGTGGIVAGGQSRVIGGLPPIKLRIYPQDFPEGVVLPAVCYNYETTPSQYLTGPANFSHGTISFEVLALTPQDKREVENTLRRMLHGYSGQWGAVPIMFCRFDNRTDLDQPPEDASDDWLYRSKLEFEVTYEDLRPLLMFEDGTTTEEIEESVVAYLASLCPVFPEAFPAGFNSLGICYSRDKESEGLYLPTGESPLHFPTLMLRIQGAKYPAVQRLAHNVANRLHGLKGIINNTEAAALLLEKESDLYARGVGGDEIFWLEQEYRFISVR